VDFDLVLGVAAAPRSFALAVGQADGSTTAGAIAQSDDGGDSWRRIDLSGISPPVRVAARGGLLRRERLRRGRRQRPRRQLVRAGDAVYANEVPTATVTVNGQPPGTPRSSTTRT
jgi:hypothetical protein